MKKQKFTVLMVRVETRVYELEVEAKSADEAAWEARRSWEDDERGFRNMGVVQTEEFVSEVQNADGVAVYRPS
jgi:hypothetical protein